MLQKLKTLAVPVLFGAYLAIFLIAVWSASFCQPSQEGQHHNAGTHSKYESCEALNSSAIGRYFLDEAEPISVGITALATIAIAWFTLSLRQSTDRLWEAGERQRIDFVETSKRELRAYLGVRGGNVRFIEPNRTSVIARVEIPNLGQTPAHNVQRYFDAVFDDADRTTFPDPPHNPGNWVIAPTACWTLTKPIDIPDTALAAIRDGKKTIFVWGKVTYETVFERGAKTHTLNFRYRLWDEENADLPGIGTTGEPTIIRKFVGWGLDPMPDGNFAD